MKRTILWLIAALTVTVSCQPAPTPTNVPPTSTLLPAPPTAVPPTSTPVPPSPTPTTPPLTGIALVVKNFYDARNAKNIDAAMAFFTDDAVYTTWTGVKYVGKTEIRPGVQFDADMNRRFEMSNVQVTGNKVTYHLKGYTGDTVIMQSDYETVVQGDKITSVTGP